MIGLGSNRLSVCRRGGMSVTQAGKGGMEWLAGGREPLWAQWWLPYSRQAGEALKAQFPTQWPTIRDYGFAHPALVPFINEDPDLVCSLVSGLPIRSLKGDGTAYINTLISQDADNAYRLGYTNVQNGVNYGPYFGGIGSQSAAYQMYRYTDGNMDYYLTSKLYRSTYDYGVRHLFEADNDKAYLDGVLLTSMSDSGNNNRGYPIGLFKAYTTQVSNGMVDKFDIHRNGVELLNQRPFRLGKAWSADKVSTGVAQAAGTCGMIDLLTGIFYPNANSSGSFTISETPAS